jgi:RNA polymerase sigma-70 factor, ECF subfamily
VDEAALLRRARQGDESAFAELYARHQRPIYRYAARMCGPQAADDVVQETFLAVLRKGDQFDAARGTLGGYLFGIARHMVLKQLNGRFEVPLDDESDTGRGASDAELHTATTASVLDILTQQERIVAVRTAIDALPPAYREVVVLCDLEELDYVSAAQAMGCPIGTIRSRLHRARALLVSRLASLRDGQGN